MNDEIDNETGDVTTFEPTEISASVAAEISQQVATAKRYPRRSDKAISTEIMSRATLDEETAAECIYSLPRAGKDITGPSIRFAEIVFASFGNLRAGARFVELDTRDPRRAAVVIEGVCLDVQMNVGQSVPVRRSITTKRGEIFGADMTNIAFAAGAAIARREAILKTVPKSIWGGAWKGVVAVLQGDIKTLGARRRSALEAFAKMGVDPARVCEVLGVAGEETITLEQMPRLIGMWTALRDGTETLESLFGRGGSTHEKVDNPLRDDPKATDRAAPQSAAIDRAAAAAQAQGRTDPISSGVHGTTERSETAATSSEKSDVAAGGATEATESGSASPGPTTQAGQNNAQDASASKPEAQNDGAKGGYHDAESYIAFMRDRFDTARGKGAVTELWGSTRQDRNDLLNQDQIDELTKDKEAILRKLKLNEGKS